jgi:hypothetical protein
MFETGMVRSCGWGGADGGVSDGAVCCASAGVRGAHIITNVRQTATVTREHLPIIGSHPLSTKISFLSSGKDIGLEVPLILNDCRNEIVSINTLGYSYPDVRVADKILMPNS